MSRDKGAFSGLVLSFAYPLTVYWVRPRSEDDTSITDFLSTWNLKSIPLATLTIWFLRGGSPIAFYLL